MVPIPCRGFSPFDLPPANPYTGAPAPLDPIPREPPIADPDQQGEAELDQPRHHHYVLAHIALRQVALANPVQYLAALASPDAREFLQAVYDAVCQHGAADLPPPDFSPADLAVHLVLIEKFPCAIVQMPPPRAVAEAHFTALLLLVDPEADPMPEPEDVQARYFTLEMGLSLDGGPRTVLAEWTDDTHHNYGDGPPADPAAFARKLAELID